MRLRRSTHNGGRPWSGVLDHWSDPLYRQSYYMLATTGVTAVTGLVFWVLTARRADPEVLGSAAGLVAANAFLSYLTGLALPYAVLRFGGSRRPVSAMVNLSLALSVVTSLVAAALFAAVAPVVAPTLAGQLRSATDVALFGLAGVGAGAGVLLDNLLAARRRAEVVLMRGAATGLARPVLVALATGDDPRPIYLAATMPALITAVAVYLALPSLLPGVSLLDFTIDATARAAGSFAARNVVGSLLSGAPQFALPLIAVGVLAAGPYAYFFTAWSIAQIVYLVPSVISNVTLSQGGAGSDHVARGRRFSLLLIAPVAVVGCLAAGPILHLYGGEYADGASTPLRLMLLAALPWTVVMLAKTQLRMEHRFVAVTALTAVFCAGSLGPPLLVGPRFGVTGMAAAWLVAVIVTAVVAWDLTRASRPRVLAGGRAR
jgi:O-antigen/teichoic acid export membrane protein